MSFLLLETGDKLLQEDSTFVLLDEYVVTRYECDRVGKVVHPTISEARPIAIGRTPV